MLARYAYYFIGVVFFAQVTQALPPPSDLLARSRRAAATRATPTPTPTPFIQYQPVQTREVIAPQAQPAQPRPVTTQGERPSTVIVIDAGHGGFDRGGISGQRVPEKTMNLDVAQRLKAILIASGYRVVMTRDSDVFIPLGTRVAIANSYRDAIFVCVHFNSARRGSANGVETYFYSSQSLPLASAIHYYVAGGAPTPNRGVKRRGFYVLRRTTIPSVLVECGFLTNPTEAQYAQSVAYRQKLAEEIARGVRERSMVGGRSSSNRLAAAAPTVPLQPFIDQTHFRDPDLTPSRHSRNSSKSKSAAKKKSSKSSDSSDDESKPSKKKKPSKSSDSSDDDSKPAKKKPSKSSDSSDDESKPAKKKKSSTSSDSSDDKPKPKKKPKPTED